MSKLSHNAIAGIRRLAAGLSGRKPDERPDIARRVARARSASIRARISHLTSAACGGERGGSGIYLIAAILIIGATIFTYYAKEIRVKPYAPGPDVSMPGPRMPEDVLDGAQEIALDNSEPVDPVDGEISQAVQAATAGEYGQAERQLRDIIRRHPGSARAKDALGTVLNNAAMQLSDSGRYTEARDYLIDAWNISDNVVIARNLAQVEIKLNDMAAAAETLEQVEGDSKAQKTLVWVYYQIASKAMDEGRRDEAIKYYEKLAVLQPGDAKLRDVIAGLKSDMKFMQAEQTANSGMGSAEGSYFTVRYEGGENAVTGHVIGILLEEAYNKVGSDMNFYPDDRIEAILYLRETFHDVTGSPSWAGALYDGKIKVPAGGVTDRSALLEKVLFHEYTHAVVHRLSGGRAPVWLNEGLAQIEEGKDEYSQRDALRTFAIAAKGNRGPVNVLRRLEGSFMGLSAEKAAVAYLLSLSATRYMTREFGVYTARSILVKMREGENLDQAFYSVLSLSYDDFCNAWLTSLRNG